MLATQTTRSLSASFSQPHFLTLFLNQQWSGSKSNMGLGLRDNQVDMVKNKTHYRYSKRQARRKSLRCKAGEVWVASCILPARKYNPSHKFSYKHKWWSSRILHHIFLFYSENVFGHILWASTVWSTNDKKKQRGLAAKSTPRVGSPGPPWRKERTDTCKLSSHTHVQASTLAQHKIK